MEEDLKIDCRYCTYSDADSPNVDNCICYWDIGEYISDPAREADGCAGFVYDDTFPKY